jgi:4-methyl-5(b-hydroxyethyl)-thiazole monophosphate biosynthesis
MSVLIPIADGSESLETVAIANVLRRGGLSVTLASIGSGLTVTGTREIKLTADAGWKEVANQDWRAIVLPGGERGAQSFAEHAALVEKLRSQRNQHRWLAAICASPALVLSPLGLLDGKQATCFPALRDKLLHYVDQPVVVDGHCVTSQGPATAIAFGLKLVELLNGAEASRQVASAMLVA